jgi:V-type H+-transporting ATPase subunit C
MSYWICAFHVAEEERPEAQFQVVKSRLQKDVQEKEMFQLNVPLNLSFRSFDALIKLVDELSKCDSQVEQTLRRVEKMWQDLSANPDYSISGPHRRTYTWKQYLQEFLWDDAKFPKSRAIGDNVSNMMNNISKLDDEVKSKVANLTELKTNLSQFTGKENIPLANRDLVEVLSPERVNPDDFVETAHMTTVICVVPRGQDKEFLASYAGWEKFVVPDSAKKVFAPDDKEGSTLWRVVLFRSSAEGFRVAARAARIVVREFTFSVEKYQEHEDQRRSLDDAMKKQEGLVKMLCKHAFSDAFVSWLHIKVMRCFVEAVLRFGVSKDGSPKFIATILKPKTSSGNVASLRNSLASLTSHGLAGDHDKFADEDGEFYPYVYLPFTPLLETQ